jgi:chromosome segregation ATPase
MTLDDSYREMCLEVEALRVSLARKVRHCDEITEERDKALRERDEARAEIATLTAALDERDLEAERGLEQYDRLMHQLADATNESTHFQVMCKRETEEVERLQVACHAWAEDVREAGRLCEQAGNEMPIDAVRRFVSSRTAIVDMLQDRLSEARSEVERLTSELQRERIGIRPVDEVRDDAYRRGAEAMREACADCVKHLSHEDGLGMGSQRLEGAIRTLPIPEEP